MYVRLQRVLRNLSHARKQNLWDCEAILRMPSPASRDSVLVKMAFCRRWLWDIVQGTPIRESHDASARIGNGMEDDIIDCDPIRSNLLDIHDDSSENTDHWQSQSEVRIGMDDSSQDLYEERAATGVTVAKSRCQWPTFFVTSISIIIAVTVLGLPVMIF